MNAITTQEKIRDLRRQLRALKAQNVIPGPPPVFHLTPKGSAGIQFSGSVNRADLIGAEVRGLAAGLDIEALTAAGRVSIIAPAVRCSYPLRVRYFWDLIDFRIRVK